MKELYETIFIQLPDTLLKVINDFLYEDLEDYIKEKKNKISKANRSYRLDTFANYIKELQCLCSEITYYTDTSYVIKIVNETEVLFINNKINVYYEILKFDENYEEIDSFIMNEKLFNLIQKFCIEKYRYVKEYPEDYAYYGDDDWYNGEEEEKENYIFEDIDEIKEIFKKSVKKSNI